MAGKRIRSRTSQGAVAVPNRPANLANVGPMRTKAPDDLLSLTKEQLKVECRKRGQKTTGTKNELLQRLGHKMASGRPNSNAPTANGSATHENTSTQSTTDVVAARLRRQQEQEEREGIVLWKQPVTTLEYFAKEVFLLLATYKKKLIEYKISVLLVVSSILTLVFVAKLGGPHQTLVQEIYKKLLWCLYWTGLGVLSSVGLGTGLHTFLLYLGPHIAQVTLAAYECGSLNFPEPPYPDEIVCPSDSDIMSISIFSIMSKVRLEAMCWGAGTALGELPPYFMARAARLSGIDPDDEDDELVEFEELQRKRKEDLTLIEKGKLFIEEIVQKVGFLGIMICASIPNPLFDLAGITCGHFLVPFWTFFGATLIGKAIVKMHLQKVVVIVAFSDTLLSSVLSWLEFVPYIGKNLQIPLKAFLDGQKLKLHQQKGSAELQEKGSILASIFEKFVIGMILYFVVSLINSLAQSYHKRLHKKKKTN